MLRFHAYTGDDAWFKAKALPVIREYVRFFDEHYKPGADGRYAYDGRWSKLYFGWAQDEVNAAYLGMTEEARVHVADRALKHPSKKHRWPVYWGPNFNELPDQDEGGIFMNAVQSMLMQYDGRKIFLLPA